MIVVFDKNVFFFDNFFLRCRNEPRKQKTGILYRGKRSINSTLLAVIECACCVLLDSNFGCATNQGVTGASGFCISHPTSCDAQHGISHLSKGVIALRVCFRWTTLMSLCEVYSRCFLSPIGIAVSDLPLGMGQAPDRLSDQTLPICIAGKLAIDRLVWLNGCGPISKLFSLRLIYGETVARYGSPSSPDAD
eukprot:GEMP01015203.1.p1 GENE.GEMP01015203.1~~GEMP01015203.1.p1  ORF type:complete len:192 (-),score=15.69 GEMP01015203.1:178-753(-)